MRTFQFLFKGFYSRSLTWKMTCGFLAAVFLLGASQESLAQPLTLGASCAKKNVLFVLDRSGSMKENNKFDDARKIIHDTAQRYDSKVRFGLETFSSAPSIDEPVPTSAANIQKTLRVVVNSGGTHMVNAMRTAAKHLTNVLSRDTVSSRPTYVLLVTDGKPNPPPCPVKEVQALRSLNVNGVKHDIKTYVVGFGSKVDVKCLNSLATAGGTALPRATYKYILASNSKELDDAMNEIVGRTASQEVCNGKDDDCDGFIDNRKGSRRDFTLVQRCQNKCGKGIQLCVRGKWQACSVSLPRKEVCNGRDDDCNGRVDDGATCPLNKNCYKGKCHRRCRGNECPNGQSCTQGVCLPNGKGGSGGGYNNGNNNGNNNNKGGQGKNNSGSESRNSTNNQAHSKACGCEVETDPGRDTFVFFWMLLLVFPLGLRLLKRRSR